MKSHEQIPRAQRPSQRRRTARVAALAIVALGVPFAAVGCGSSSSSAGGDQSSGAPTKDAAATRLAISAGAEIPKATVRLGMQPFGDHSIYVQGVRRGYFKDVGIEIAPQPLGESVDADKVVTRLVSKDLDIVSWYGSLQVQSMAKAPDVTMLGFSDTYVGTYILASPDAKAKSVADIVKQGKPFDEAMKETIGQLKGKRVALNDNGGHREFFNTTFGLGGLSFKDVKLTSLSDARQFELAKGGKLDFASPAGAAQTAALFNLGWTPVVGAQDLVNGLPPADPRAVSGIGHTGPGALKSWYDTHQETALRFMSVMYRIIDDIAKDPEAAIKDQAPYVKSVTGVDLGVSGLKSIFENLDPLVGFSDQAKYWVDPKNPDYYANVYAPQVKAAEVGGVLPKGKFTAKDVTIGAQVYEELAKLKQQYDDLLPKASGLSGAKAKAAKAAKAQYGHFNYLDAYRMLKTAVEGA